ncbi:hypothetical protein EST38_g9168 [Candolleomyces aberdarensis]|uniref:Uncharacterized protein n=1 Tax=Candolleomyces aberdarensis TaxID=2316362 RepID=A0A4Q2DDI1_9AGAR|nr:hypothetical protein EST38_g9168 [Candolleomyces aberdarensis]
MGDTPNGGDKVQLDPTLDFVAGTIALEHADAVPTLSQIALAGAGSGIISSPFPVRIITTPTELIKIRQQSLLVPTTARQIAWQIFRENGIRGLYRGITATALRDTGYGAYFFAYEATCRLFSSPPSIDPTSTDLMAHVEKGVNTLSWPALLLAGGVAGIAGWVMTFPFDVVKTRIQGSHPIYSTALPHAPFSTIANHSARAYSTATVTTPLLDTIGFSSHGPKDLNPYRSTWSTIVHSYRNEGAGVFFRGLSPTLIRAIPVNMVTFATFEAVVKACS